MRAAAFFLLVASPMLILAQSTVITFSAERAGAPHPIDSIHIVNVGRHVDTVLYAPDTVLVLITTSILDHQGGDVGVRVTGANPYTHSTTVDLGMEKSGRVSMVLMDIMGRALYAAEHNLGPGNHRFDLVGGQGAMMFVAEVNGRRSIQRVVAVEGAMPPAIRARSANKGNAPGRSKSGAFVWVPGDTLAYTGWCTMSAPIGATGQGQQNVPIANMNVVFDLPASCEYLDVVHDAEGRAYSTVRIGAQCWMAENLSTGAFNNGDPIPNSTAWGVQTPAWCSQDNSPEMEAIYGKLYNWYVVSDPRGVCPAGWHVATLADWTALGNELGGEDVAGGALKSTSSLWMPPNTGATNASGFSALPGGYRYWPWPPGGDGHWWTASQPSGSMAYYTFIHLGSAGMFISANPKLYGYSIRCVKD